MGHSPQRRRWVTEPEEIEPLPATFAIVPQYNQQQMIVAFTIEDPDADIIRSRDRIAAAIHQQFPEVSKADVAEEASISYYDYRVVVVLRQ